MIPKFIIRFTLRIYFIFQKGVLYILIQPKLYSIYSRSAKHNINKFVTLKLEDQKVEFQFWRQILGRPEL